jgi:hypothetical protein
MQAAVEGCTAFAASTAVNGAGGLTWHYHMSRLRGWLAVWGWQCVASRVWLAVCGCQDVALGP